jgi:DEAD/DEAH box helicase domain-containing protein
MEREIYLDVETQRLAHEVPGGWTNIRAFGLAVAVTWDDAHGFRTWWEADAPQLIAELKTFDRIITFNGERFDFPVLSGYGPVGPLYLKSFDLHADLTRRLARRVSFQALVRATLGQSKSGSGEDAVRWWRAGDVARVLAYCQRDVELLREIVRFARERGYVRLPPDRIVPVAW